MDLIGESLFIEKEHLRAFIAAVLVGDVVCSKRYDDN